MCYYALSSEPSDENFSSRESLTFSIALRYICTFAFLFLKFQAIFSQAKKNHWKKFFLQTM
jgi:hypothetical protein